jgi:hypothetical protein
MGKSWKGDNAWKYKKDKNFQKKQKQKHKGQKPVAYPPSEFIPEYDTSAVHEM